MGSPVWFVVEGGTRERGRERKRDEAPLALRATRPHTVGHIGGSDQEQGESACVGSPATLQVPGISQLGHESMC